MDDYVFLLLILIISYHATFQILKLALRHRELEYNMYLENRLVYNRYLSLNYR